MSYVVIIDFSHLFHQCRYAALNAGPTYNLANTIFSNAQGKLRTIRKILEKHRIKEYDLIFAEDRPPRRKLEMYPNYRQGRINLSDSKEDLKRAFIEDGHRNRFCHADDNEADDVMATLVKLANSRGGLYTVIVTGDRDLWSLISPTTAVLNPLKKALVTPEDIHNAFAVTPIHIGLVKALWGDSADCIPNACPRTQKQLLPILRQSPNGLLTEFKDLVTQNWQALTPKCRDLLNSGMPQIELNWQLILMDDQCRLLWD